MVKHKLKLIIILKLNEVIILGNYHGST